MPISRKKAIFYCKSKRRDGPIENNNESLVQLVNFGQYLSSYVVFSQSKEIIEKHITLFKNEMILPAAG